MSLSNTQKYSVVNNKNNYKSNKGKNNNDKVGGKFCKICKDYGKSFEEYTNHYVRESLDPNSKVVCPVLNAAICRYCKESGHTIKHCRKLQTKNNHEENNKKNNNFTKHYCMTIDENNDNNNDKHISSFSLLTDEGSDDDICNDNITNTNISISPNVTTPPNIRSIELHSNNIDNKSSYANILKNSIQRNKNIENTTITPMSQLHSLIPTKLDFSDVTNTSIDNSDDTNTHTFNSVITLYDITGRWCDIEDEDDKCYEDNILNFVTTTPILNNIDHPLHYYNEKMIDIISNYTDNFTKNIRITSDAFEALFNRWDREFFTNNDNTIYKNMMDATSSYYHYRYRLSHIMDIVTY